MPSPCLIQDQREEWQNISLSRYIYSKQLANSGKEISHMGVFPSQVRIEHQEDKANPVNFYIHGSF